MVQIQGKGNDSREESAKFEAKRACARTPIHPSIPSLSSSNMISSINDKTPGERYVEKEGYKGVIYIYTPNPHNHQNPQVGEE